MMLFTKWIQYLPYSQAQQGDSWFSLFFIIISKNRYYEKLFLFILGNNWMVILRYTRPSNWKFR